MSRFRYFGGIDWSGAREPLSNLWTALGEARDGRLHVRSLCPHPFRADLAAFVAGGWRRHLDAAEEDAALWGADFPFGLPEEAARRIAGERRPSWAGMAAWVADRPADEVRDAFPEMRKRPRATDTGTALAPLDLRLYKQTVEGIRWLHELRDALDVSIPPVAPDADARDVVIEVYPAGTIAALGLKGIRRPGRPGAVRALPAALRPYVTFEHPSLEAAAMTLDDARDACIAALTAWLCRDDLEQPRRRSGGGVGAFELEGYIYLPPDALGG
jgi:hypothetical protein